MLVLIPAYEPGDSLIALVRELRAHPAAPNVLVVDDGSGPNHDEIFALARIHGATVHRYQENRGKGHALKTGFAIARRYHPGEVVVCADSDGQHKVPDIMRVAREVDVDSREMVLGGRRFTGRVPLRSAFGNKVTSWLFKTLTAIRVGDTQTGLRAYPPSMLEWLGTIPGERFEYELSLLLQARKAGISIREIEIETVYLHGNRSSHPGLVAGLPTAAGLRRVIAGRVCRRLPSPAAPDGRNPQPVVQRDHRAAAVCHHQLLAQPACGVPRR